MSPSNLKDWKPAKLGSYLKIKHGYAFKSEHFSDSGSFILLTPGNFWEQGGLKLKGEKEKYFTGTFPSEYICKHGDLLIAMTDLIQNAPILGSPAIIPENNKFLHNQRLGKVIDLNEEELTQGFLFYLLNAPYVRAQIKATATGSTVRHTAPDRIYTVDVAIPPLPVQRKIAAILSAYDDLIENNTRRIKILEEMAQSLYREWFVNFRFPGHEQVQMVDSALGLIPEGWRIKKLGSVAAVNADTLKGSVAPAKINYIDIASVSTGEIDKIESIAFEKAPSRARRIVRHGDIIWSTVRPNRKSYALILDPVPELIVSTGFAVITASSVPSTYLYYVLTTDRFVGYLTNHATGAAYPAVNSDNFRQADILCPSSHLLEHFHDFVAPILDHKQNLQTKNANLRRTRDLLLPRLISGELDVADLDIDLGEDAV